MQLSMASIRTRKQAVWISCTVTCAPTIAHVRKLFFTSSKRAMRCSRTSSVAETILSDITQRRASSHTRWIALPATTSGVGAVDPYCP